jgi:hypothetical protein
MPKKDVAIRNSSGEKIHKHKRLVICNIKELYLKYKNEYPNEKVGLSKFAELRSKWCVLVVPIQYVLVFYVKI